jgi:glycosyltransferase involved in cell wall biosynthesis
MPAYNSASFIKETITGVINQDYGNWELIIVDDGSTDDTANIVQSIDPRIQLIQQQNSGIAAARNTGVQNSNGQLIAFLDHDDLWHPNKLSSQVKAINAHPEAGIVYSIFKRWDPQFPPEFDDISIDYSLIDNERSGWIYPLLLQTNWVLFSTAVFHREVFDKIGLFDTNMPPADDWELAIRASRHYQFLMLSQPLVLYRVHPKQTSKRLTIKNHEADLRSNVIKLYGLIGPDGKRADSDEINLRQYRAYVNHGNQHLEANSLQIARESFFRALRIKPHSPKIWLKLIYSFLPYRPL